MKSRKTQKQKVKKSKCDIEGILRRGDSEMADRCFQQLEENGDYKGAAQLAQEFGIMDVAREYDKLDGNPWVRPSDYWGLRGLIRRAIEDY